MYHVAELTVTMGSATQRSPIENSCTELPTAATVPTISWPGTSYKILSRLFPATIVHVRTHRKFGKK